MCSLTLSQWRDLRMGMKYVLWNAGICPIAEILWKTASPRKTSLTSGNRLLGYGQKTISNMTAIRHFEFKKMHIWSCDCHWFPNLLLCTKFHQNWMIFRWHIKYGDLTIFKMTAFRHLEFSTFEVYVMWPLWNCYSAYPRKISLKLGQSAAKL